MNKKRGLRSGQNVRIGILSIVVSADGQSRPSSTTTKGVTVRILVIEDNMQHLGQAKAYAQRLKDCTVDFAVTLNDAMQCLRKNSYDGVISDVFFPAKVGDPADTWKNAVTISATLVEMGIHHVFNTAGNHHQDTTFDGFFWKTPRAVHNGDTYHFLSTGMVIDVYPEDKEMEKDTKQWQAAFRYILLVQALLKLPDKGASVIERDTEIFDGFPYGECGGLTDRFDRCEDPFVVEVFRRYNT